MKHPGKNLLTFEKFCGLLCVVEVIPMLQRAKQGRQSEINIRTGPASEALSFAGPVLYSGEVMR